MVMHHASPAPMVRHEANPAPAVTHEEITRRARCASGTRVALLATSSPYRAGAPVSDYIYAVRLGLAFGLLGVVLLFVAV
jgi:hypothetical protein